MSADDICRIYQTAKGEFSHSNMPVEADISYHQAMGIRYFKTLEEAIRWHNINCSPEYGLDVTFELEQLMTIAPNTIVETYSRRVFTVEAIQVEEGNMSHIATWCGGKVLTTKTGVPFVEVPTGKAGVQSHSRAFAGSWVVTGRGGYFSSYSDKAFQRTFERR